MRCFPEWHLPAGSLSCLHICSQLWAKLTSVPDTPTPLTWSLMVCGLCSLQSTHGHLLGMPILLSLEVGTPCILNTETQFRCGEECKLDDLVSSMRLKWDNHVYWALSCAPRYFSSPPVLSICLLSSALFFYGKAHWYVEVKEGPERLVCICWRQSAG